MSDHFVDIKKRLSLTLLKEGHALCTAGQPRQYQRIRLAKQLLPMLPSYSERISISTFPAPYHVQCSTGLRLLYHYPDRPGQSCPLPSDLHLEWWRHRGLQVYCRMSWISYQFHRSFLHHLLGNYALISELPQQSPSIVCPLCLQGVSCFRDPWKKILRQNEQMQAAYNLRFNIPQYRGRSLRQSRRLP